MPIAQGEVKTGVKVGEGGGRDSGKKLSSKRLNALTLGVSHLVTPEAPTLYLCI